jgi:hypothetical protein
MADVFISYSRTDKGYARLVATTLEAEGISVWWDSDLVPGDEYDAEIERQIATAKCVLVIWSRESVKSRWVRSEATAGDDRKILIPVAKEPVRLPLAFRLLQTEDLSNWQGERDAEAWQRVLFQVRALLGLPLDLSDRSKQDDANKPIGGQVVLRSSIAPLAAIAVLVVVLVIWGQRSNSFAVALGLALLAFFLFRFAEHDLSPHMKALATRWLLPQDGQFSVNTPEAFNYLFEAVFGRRHFTAECFVRSTLISAAFLTIILVLSMLRFGYVIHGPSAIIAIFLFGFIVNPLGDYIALFKTRILLQRYKAGMNIIPIILIDIVGIFLIFITAISVSAIIIYGIIDLTGGISVVRNEPCLSFNGYLDAVWKSVALAIHQPIIDFFGQDSTTCGLPKDDLGGRILLYSSFLTMFMTSLWLWIALLLSPIIRFLVWSRGTGLTFIGFIFDVHNAPFAAMGYLSAFLILVCGALVWGAGEVAAAVRSV